MAGETRHEWQWQLRASPEALWPHVCNTERFNKAAGLPEPTFTDVARTEGGSDRTAEANQVGMTLRWKEHPFEWVAPRWLGVLREYENGPIATMRMNISLAALPQGGSLLTYRVDVTPSGFVGKMVQNFEFTRLKAQFERVFRRIDDKVMEAATTPHWHVNLDPFEAPTDRLNSRGIARLNEAAKRLRAWQLPDIQVAERLINLVRYGADHAVERLRPVTLARMWDSHPDTTLDVCLIAAHVGLLELSWSVLCPGCRSAAAETPSLSRLAPSTHCDACNIDFETEFVESVELSFRTAAAIRSVTPGTYCLGGPGHAQTTNAQLWLQPGEQRQVQVQLGAGAWRVAGPRTRGQAYFETTAQSNDAQANEEQARQALPTVGATLVVNPTPRIEGAVAMGQSELQVRNDSTFDQVLRIERAVWRDDAVTAAQVMTRSTFRQLFSADVLSPGQHVDVGHVAILFTDLQGSTALYEQIGDAAAYAMVRRHFDVLDEVIARHRGAIVKTIGDAVMGAWHDPLDAVIAALSLQAALNEYVDTAHLGIKAGVHWGRCIGVTVNGTFDYFGTTVNTAARLERVAGAGQVAISDALAQEPTVKAWLAERPGCIVRMAEATLKGLTGTHLCPVLSGESLRDSLISTGTMEIAPELLAMRGDTP